MKKSSKMIAAAVLAMSVMAGYSVAHATPPAAGQLAAQHAANAPARRQAAAQQAQVVRADVQAKKAACGDINGDGIQNAQDASLCACDANGDLQLDDTEKANCSAQAQAKKEEVKATAQSQAQAAAAQAQASSGTTQ